MTRSKKLKKIIRQRARKTGERYTAARRQVLLARAGGAAATAVPKAPRTTSSPAGSAASGGKTRGSVSAANAVKQTGKSLDHWFAVLDAFDARAKGHAAAARHLYEAHGVPGWHAQGITVAYERDRGVRVMNQCCDGTFQVGVSRVAHGSMAEVIRALSEKTEREAWLRGADSRLAPALHAAFEGPKARAVKVKDARNAHLRYPWDRTTIELRITGKPAGGASVSVGNINLAGPDEVESRRASWRVALDGLKQHLSR